MGNAGCIGNFGACINCFCRILRKQNAELTTKIRIRHRPGITSGDRVIHDGRVYDIQSVIDYRSARRELVLLCKG